MNRIIAPLALCLLAACSVNLDNIPCSSDAECETGAYCNNGKCVVGPTCTGTTTLCHDGCVELSSNQANCGDCGKACTAPSGGSAICTSSSCVITPAAVTGLTLTTTLTQVSLTWQSVPGADGYPVSRGTAQNGPFALIASPTTNSYVDHIVTGANTYFYVVAATINGHAGAASSAVSTGSSIPAPRDFALSSALPSQVNLQWTQLIGATSYSISRSTDGTNYSALGTAPAMSSTTISYVDLLVEGGTRYWYEVSAVEGSMTGQASAPLQVTTPLALSGLTVAATPTVASLSWPLSQNATGYLVSYSTDNGTTFSQPGSPIAGTSIDINPVGPGTKYVFRVVAVNAIATSSPDDFPLTTPLAGPTLTLQSTTNNTASFMWTQSANATLYQLTRQDSLTATPINIGSPTSFLTETDPGPLSPGNTYAYQVSASNTVSANNPGNTVFVQIALGAPVNFTAAPASSTQVSLLWNSLGAAATGYNVQYSSNGGALWTNASSSTPTTNTNSYVVNGLMQGTGYQFRVQGVNGTSGGAYALSSATTALDPVGMNTPLATSSTVVSLSWGNSTNATQYIITATPQGQPSLPTAQTSSNGYSYPGLQPGTQYSFSVVAKNSISSSVASNTVTVVTPLDAPVLSFTNLTATSVTLNWSSPTNATSYLVARSQSGGPFTNNPSGQQTTNTATDTNLLAGTSYAYEVTATNAVFTTGTVSNVVTVSFPLAVPTGLSASAVSSSSASLTWGTVLSATGYNLQRSTNGAAYTPVNNATPSTTSMSSYTDNGAISGTRVTYQIQSYNGNTSAFSPASSAIIIPLDPPVNVHGSLAADNSSINLSWTPNTFASGYSVSRAINGGTAAAYGSGNLNGTFIDNGPFQTGNAYSYVVQTTTAVATSIASQSVNIPVPLATPTLSITGQSPGSVSLSWGSTVPNATLMQIFRQQGTGAATGIGTANQTQTSYTDTTSAPGTSYSYYVVAQNTTSGVNSAPSNTVQLVTPLNTPAITQVQLASGNLSVTWSSSTNATSYDLQSSTDSGITWSELGPHGGLNLTDTSVVPGQQYVYRVQALVSGASSSFSAASTPAVIVPLAAVANAMVTSSTSTAVSLGWDPVLGAGGYIVSRSLDNLTFAQLGTTPTTATNSYTDSTVTGGTTYYYKIVAWTSVTTGASGATSTTTPLAIPTPLTGSYSSPKIIVTWGISPGATGYILQRSTDNTNFTTVSTSNVTTYNDNSVGTNSVIYYKVQATTVATASAMADTIAVFVPPAAPVVGTPTVTQGFVLISWGAVNGAISYNIFRSTDNVNFALIETLYGNASTNFSDQATSAGITWHYEVQSSSGALLSGMSNSVAATISAASAAAPTNFKITAVTQNTISFSWTALSPLPGGYRLLRSTDGVAYLPAGLPGPSATSFIDSIGLTPGEAVWYELEGANSVANNSTPTTLPTLPVQTTTSQVYPPNNLIVTSSTPGANALQWDAVATASSYDVYYSSDGAGWSSLVVDLVPGTNFYTDNTVIAGSLTYYSVTDFFNNGNESPKSQVLAVVNPLGMVSNISADTSSDSEIVLSWSPPPGGSPGYIVNRQDITSSPFATTMTNSFTDTSVAANTAYSYTIQAVSPNYLNAPVSPLFTTGRTAIAALDAPPINFNAVAQSAAEVLIKWNAPSATPPTGYTIIRGTDGSNFPVSILASGTQYSDFSVFPGTTYYYKIQANYPGEAGSEFTAAAVTTTSPQSPTLTAAGGANQVTLNWTASTGASEYFVDRSLSPTGPFTNLIMTSYADATDATPATNTTYYYRVTAAGGGPSSPPSNVVSVTTNPNNVSGSKLNLLYNGDPSGQPVGTRASLDSSSGVRALIPPAQAGGAWTIIQGLSSHDGYFVIPNVPAGNYVLNLPGNGYQFVNQRSFDLSFVTSGSLADSQPVIQPSNVNFTISNLGAWQSNDLLEIVSLGPNLFLYNGQQGTPGVLGLLTPGATSTVLTVDVATLHASLAVDEDVYFAQLEPRAIGGLTYLTATHYVDQQSVSFFNGLTTGNQINLVDQTVGASHTIPINWKRSAFKSLISSINPNAQNGTDSIALSALPGATAHGVYAGGLDLVSINPPFGTNDVDYTSVQYWDIYPSGWDKFGQFFSGATVEFLLPGSSFPYLQNANLIYQDTFSAFTGNMAAGLFVPQISPVQNPQIQGVNAFLTNVNVGLNPTISWQPPATGTASHYSVVITQLQIDGGTNATVFRAQNGFLTTGTSIVVPPGILHAGVPAFARITAANSPGFAITSPHRFGIGLNQADCVTGLFTP